LPDTDPTPPESSESRRRRFRSNQIAVMLTTSMVFMGFTIVMPLLPFFLVELGVQDPAAVARWTGLLLTVTPLLAACMGPVWGRLADRVGLKIMAQRVLLTMTITWTLMFVVTSVYQVLALRILLGLFSGYMTISVALVTQGGPVGSIGPAVGRLQATQIMSAAAGPVIGGMLANWIGIRPTFLVTGTMCGAGLILIGFLYRDVPAEPTAPEPEKQRHRGTALYWKILSGPGFLPVVALLFAATLVDRSFSAVLPILVAELHTDGAAAAPAAGLVLSAGWFAAAASAWMLGRWSGRIAPQVLIGTGFALGAVFTLPMALVGHWGPLVFLRAGLGFAVGGIVTVAYTLGGRRISSNRATSYALLGSAALFGGALGPGVSGFLAGLDLRFPYYGNAILYIILALCTLVWVRGTRNQIESSDGSSGATLIPRESTDSGG
jgi:MFS family permease